MYKTIINKQKQVWIRFNHYTHSSSMEIAFSQVLSEIMKKRGLNQLTLANILGIRQSQISNWLNGKSLPGYYSLKLLCEKLDVSAEQLLK